MKQIKQMKGIKKNIKRLAVLPIPPPLPKNFEKQNSQKYTKNFYQLLGFVLLIKMK